MVGERTRFWIDFASTLFKLTLGMRWLVVDEVHNFAPKGKIMDPDAGKAGRVQRAASSRSARSLPSIRRTGTRSPTPSRWHQAWAVTEAGAAGPLSFKRKYWSSSISW